MIGTSWDCVVWIMGWAGLIVGVGFVWARWPNRGNQLRYWFCVGRARGQHERVFLFAGVLTAVVSLVSLIAITFLTPREQPPQSRPDYLVMIEDSVLVRFKNKQGENSGPKIFADNALAAAILKVCQVIDSSMTPGAMDGRDDFMAWLRKLFAWEPAPLSLDALSQERSTLILFDGSQSHELSGGGRLADRLRVEWTTKNLTSARLGLPTVVVNTVADPGRKTTVILIATADVDAARQLDEWRARVPHVDRVIVILVPSLARSGENLADLRGHDAKARLLHAGGADLLRLDDLPAQPGEIQADRLPLIGALGEFGLNAKDLAPIANKPRDLGPERIKAFGPKQVMQVEARNQQPLWSAPLVQRIAPPMAAVSVSRPRIAAMVFVASLVAFALGLALILGGGRPFAWRAPNRADRIASALLGLLGLLALLAALWWSWPGKVWRQSGYPSLAIWAYVASWTVFVASPITLKTLTDAGLADRKFRTIHAFIFIFCLVLPPAVGLVLAPWVRILSWLSLGLAATMASLGIIRAPGVPVDTDRWTSSRIREWAWPITATLVSFWIGAILIGASPARADARTYACSLAWLLVGVWAITALMFFLSKRKVA
jgi:hypothetical protein